MIQVNQDAKLDPGCIVSSGWSRGTSVSNSEGVALIGLECTFLWALGTHFCNIWFTTNVLAVPTSGYGF